MVTFLLTMRYFSVQPPFFYFCQNTLVMFIAITASFRSSTCYHISLQKIVMFCEQPLNDLFNKVHFLIRRINMFKMVTNVRVSYLPNIRFWRCIANFSLLALILKGLAGQSDVPSMWFFPKCIF